MKENLVIGVLGGMGTYATIHLFKQYADVFPAEKEWERPRIIIDNRCTMPSRVRAFLLGEKVDVLVKEMADSLEMLANAGCTRILLACNTSHLFLPKIYSLKPGVENKIVNIIEACVEKVRRDDIRHIYLLGSEGTIESQIYQNAFAKNGIECEVPQKEEYVKLRELIEAVKQNKYDDRIGELFRELVNRGEACILGCTELPILQEKYKNEVGHIRIYDPLLIGLEKIKEEVVYE
ncbi:MAG: aspartate/glutamate racemase family protein [Lachnospiraceae bacterium]|nr:aspartate/glutamate racemase family protein [Lachnospiraceae bacterium]